MHHPSGKKEHVQISIIKGKNKKCAVKVGGGYVMIKDFADKHFGEAHKKSLKDIDNKAEALELFERRKENVHMLFKNYFYETMQGYRMARLAKEKEELEKQE
jgi:hypothetical protein